MYNLCVLRLWYDWVLVMNVLKSSVSFIFVYIWVNHTTCCQLLLAHSSLYTKPITQPAVSCHWPTAHYTPNQSHNLLSVATGRQFTIHQTNHTTCCQLPLAHSSLHTKPITQPAVSCHWPTVHSTPNQSHNLLSVATGPQFTIHQTNHTTCCQLPLAPSSIYTKPITQPAVSCLWSTVHSTPNQSHNLLSVATGPQFTIHQTNHTTCCQLPLAHSSLYTKPITKPAVICHWPTVHYTPNQSHNLLSVATVPQFTIHQTNHTTCCQLPLAHSSLHTKPITQSAVSCHCPAVHYRPNQSHNLLSVATVPQFTIDQTNHTTCCQFPLSRSSL